MTCGSSARSPTWPGRSRAASAGRPAGRPAHSWSPMARSCGLRTVRAGRPAERLAHKCGIQRVQAGRRRACARSRAPPTAPGGPAAAPPRPRTRWRTASRRRAGARGACTSRPPPARTPRPPCPGATARAPWTCRAPAPRRARLTVWRDSTPCCRMRPHRAQPRQRPQRAHSSRCSVAALAEPTPWRGTPAAAHCALLRPDRHRHISGAHFCCSRAGCLRRGARTASRG